MLCASHVVAYIILDIGYGDCQSVTSYYCVNKPADAECKLAVSRHDVMFL